MSAPPDSLQCVFDNAFAGLSQGRETFTPQLTPREAGTVTSVSTGIAKVSGLPGVGSDELVKFPGDVFGIAFNVDEDEIGVVLLGEYWHLHAGDEVERTGRVMDVAVGDGLLGRVIDPLGRPLDGNGPLVASRRLPSERPAPAIMDRAPVNVPLQTGLKVIDALIPIGRGQRELILGDRQTGKTAIAIDTILNQRDKDVLCVYCAIGQRASAVAKAVAILREKGAMEYSVVLVTEGNDPPGLAYIAPYAATSIAEHFMEAGRDVLIVYDDLTHHARAYRELSLLLCRPPGREAFPGDIFYIHSRLLERATHLFYNRPAVGGYAPVSQRLLPLDEIWRCKLAERPWPTENLPEVIGGGAPTLRVLIREYLFVSLFRACAESLASENASRLAAMQRADKNIGELLDDLNGTFHRLRQSGIDAELFDVISGFEALNES